MSANENRPINIKEDCKTLINGIKASFKDFYDYEEASKCGASEIQRNTAVAATSVSLRIAKEIAKNIPDMINSNTIILTKNKPGTPTLYGPTQILISTTTGYEQLVKLLSDSILYGCISKYFEDSTSPRVGYGVGILTVTSNENLAESESYDLGNPEDVYRLIND